MARREIFRSTSKNPALFNNYQCVNCNRNHLLKDSVQPISGHWLCTCCADKLLKDRYKEPNVCAWAGMLILCASTLQLTEMPTRFEIGRRKR